MDSSDGLLMLHDQILDSQNVKESIIAFFKQYPDFLRNFAASLFGRTDFDILPQVIRRWFTIKNIISDKSQSEYSNLYRQVNDLIRESLATINNHKNVTDDDDDNQGYQPLPGESHEDFAKKLPKREPEANAKFYKYLVSVFPAWKKLCSLLLKNIGMNKNTIDQAYWSQSTKKGRRAGEIRDRLGNAINTRDALEMF
jgi:hypothetical protein